MNSETCVLDDGTRVRFSLKKRARDPFYLASFRGPDGRRRELSSKEENKKRAIDAAIVLIRAAFEPATEARKNPSWDEAVEAMTRQAVANNLRTGTIQQYIIAIKHLRRAFPATHGPAEITPTMASRFKADRKNSGGWGRGISVRTLKGNIDSLNIVYNKWWIRESKILTSNPFAEVSPPKLDKPRPRVLLPEEVTSFLDWMATRWRGWRLPILFLETKRLLGCRIMELASASTDALRDGRLYFPADETKGRKERGVRLPAAVYEELRSIAGKQYVWECFADELRRVYLSRGWRRASRIEATYQPARFRKWLQRQKREYLKKNPTAKAFKLHNLRGTAMTRAKEAGISYEDAAVAFGCNPDTMRKHYVALDETLIADRVMEAIQTDGDCRTTRAHGEGQSSSSSESPVPSAPEGGTNR
jgi:integrase